MRARAERKKETNDGEGDGGNGSNTLNTLNGGGVREEHARRPVDAAAAEALARGDRYGHHKLRCEEILAKIASTRGMDGRATSNGEEAPDLSSSSSDDAAAWSDDSDDDDSDDSENESESDDDGHDDDDVNDDDLVPVPWLAIRLPDVIGPRDGTYRLWRYQMWVQCVDILGPVVVSPDLATGGSRALSFAYAPDVAALVAKVARGECDARSGVRTTWRACERVSSRRSSSTSPSAFAQDWGRKVGTRGGTRRREERREVREPGRGRKRGWDDSAEATEVGSLVRTSSRQRTSPEFYPSVDGGAIDPSRAIGELGFAPTPLRDAVRETVLGARGCARGAGTSGAGTRRGCAAVEKKFRVEALLGGRAA